MYLWFWLKSELIRLNRLRQEWLYVMRKRVKRCLMRWVRMRFICWRQRWAGVGGVIAASWVPGFWALIGQWLVTWHQAELWLVQLRFVLRDWVIRCWRWERRRLITGWWHCSWVITVILCHGDCVLAMDLEMLPQRRRMSVALVTAPHSAVVWFVCGMNMHVLLTITGVSKPSVTSLHLTLKWFLT